MNAIGKVFFAIAALGGAGFLAGILWTLLAQALWGRPAGPPPHLSPEEARAWTHEHPGGANSPYTMSWEDVRAAVREGRWHEVWPVLLATGGLTGVLVFLPLGVLLGTDARWSGAVGLAVTLIILWRGYRALWRNV